MASVQCAISSTSQSIWPNPAAIRYAIGELAHRAGVSDEWFRSWRIEFDGDALVTVYVQPGTRKRVRFVRCPTHCWEQIRGGSFQTSIGEWPWEEGARSRVTTDFRIPFSTSDRQQLGPLFTPEERDSYICGVDLPLSILLTLSRFEESLPGPRDCHGRFSAHSSVAWREGFLHRPIVDEYGLALEQILIALLPGWRPSERKLRVKLGHDVDEIGIPFSLRTSTALTLRYARPLDTARDILGGPLGIDTAYQHQLRRLVAFSIERQLHPAVYWKASAEGPHDTGYDLRDKRLQRMMQEFRSANVEMGIHPSYGTFHSLEILRSEVHFLRELLEKESLGGRQDYLRWSPQTWAHWDSLGLAYDASVGFADHVGFRAGTCFPYQPWLWTQQRKAELLEIPLIAMDSTMQGYMKLSPQQTILIVRSLMDKCRGVGGVFTLAWHNTRILDDRHAAAYRTILDELRGVSTYDWRSNAV